MPITHMPLVRVQRKGLITIPLKLREKLGVEEGDFLSVELVDGKIVYKPQVVLDREAVNGVVEKSSPEQSAG